jgi:hypothetical protein
MFKISSPWNQWFEKFLLYANAYPEAASMDASPEKRSDERREQNAVI